MFSKFIRFLGSVRLAVPLLAVIALILIGATLLESQVGSAIVQRDIYKSTWFGALMFLLAMNLGVSTFTRFPWRGARKIGFALTHMGLIVLIAGSAAVIHLSTEGMLLVRTDSIPRDEIRVEGDLLDVITPDQQHLQTNVFLRSDGTVYPKQVGELALLGYSENVQKTTSFVNGGAVKNLAVRLSMHSDRMGQTLGYWLAAAPVGFQSLELGPARLELFQATTAQTLEDSLAEPEQVGELGELEIQQGRKKLSVDVAQSIGKSQPIGEGFTIEVTDVWPDFRLTSEGQPSTASQQFRNPAIQLLVSKGEIQERWYIFGNAAFPTIRSDNALRLDESAIAFHAPSTNASDFFRIIAGPDQDLYYAANSSKGFVSGPLTVGATIVPGWADFQLTLEEVLDRAQIKRSVLPAVSTSPNPTPALHVATPDGHDHWLPWGDPLTLESDLGNYFAAFSPKVLKLPFQVQLNDFIVERNEGSESVAMWTSDINLSHGRGETDRRKVWMNHPTWFQGWKLAQASWNPGDLSQSTLQLKREPWWVTALTWLGSLLVVSGIGTMFYGRAIAKRLQTFSPPELEPEIESETKPDIAPA